MKKVMVFGTFDGIHEGHRAFLRQARTSGQRLIVAVASDKMVQLLKFRRAKYNEQERKNALKELKLADVVVVGDNTPSAYEVVKKHRPDVIAFGYDQRDFYEDVCKYVNEFDFSVELKIMDAYHPELYHSSLLK